MSSATSSTLDPTPINSGPLATALGALGLVCALAYHHSDARMAVLALVGAGLGIALYHGSFGFTAGWRRYITSGDGRNFAAQFILIALTGLLFVPIIGGWLPGIQAGGFYAPVGIGLMCGAFLFGLGMQLGNGCGSGTLFTMGGGSTRMVITLAAFIVGSLLGTFHFDWWMALPRYNGSNLVTGQGVLVTITAQSALLLALAWYVNGRSLDIATHQSNAPPMQRSTATTLLRGPWPIAWVVGALFLLNLATLLIAGRPWGITSAFALWGGKLADGLGYDLSQHTYWTWGWTQAGLNSSVFADTTSVMDFGIIAGAMAAAAAAGRFNPARSVPWRSALAALLGGLLMGYGARLAAGCNIGAFLGGIASGSLHGWAWLVAAFIGSMVGIRLRPLFGLSRT